MTLPQVPALQDAVVVLGYPRGGDNLCITSGVVSRVDVNPYAHSNTWSEPPPTSTPQKPPHVSIDLSLRSIYLSISVYLPIYLSAPLSLFIYLALSVCLPIYLRLSFCLVSCFGWFFGNVRRAREW